MMRIREALGVLGISAAAILVGCQSAPMVQVSNTVSEPFHLNAPLSAGGELDYAVGPGETHGFRPARNAPLTIGHATARVGSRITIENDTSEPVTVAYTADDGATRRTILGQSAMTQFDRDQRLTIDGVDFWLLQ